MRNILVLVLWGFSCLSGAKVQVQWDRKSLGPSTFDWIVSIDYSDYQLNMQPYYWPGLTKPLDNPIHMLFLIGWQQQECGTRAQTLPWVEYAVKNLGLPFTDLLQPPPGTMGADGNPVPSLISTSFIIQKTSSTAVNATTPETVCAQSNYGIVNATNAFDNVTRSAVFRTEWYDYTNGDTDFLLSIKQYTNTRNCKIDLQSPLDPLVPSYPLMSQDECYFRPNGSFTYGVQSAQLLLVGIIVNPPVPNGATSVSIIELVILFPSLFLFFLHNRFI